jgi:hypothetical protein
MAYSKIAESLLEMHYFRTMVRHYRRALGGRQIQVFKPATTMEHWYGFDQAYFRANIPKPLVIEDLKNYIYNRTAPRFTSFRAFLLQFKVVKIAKKRSALSPPRWKAPYYRAELYLEPNRTTGISQHEALRRLSELPGASVSYVCPMIFEENDVLRRPLFSDLRFVDVASSPTGWLTTERHFIAYQTTGSAPTWCSEPVPGEPLTIDKILQRAAPMSADELFTLIDKMRTILLHTKKAMQQSTLFEYDSIPNIFPAALSIVAELHDKRTTSV